MIHQGDGCGVDLVMEDKYLKWLFEKPVEELEISWELWCSCGTWGFRIGLKDDCELWSIGWFDGKPDECES